MKITIERNPVIWLILISLTMLTSIFIHSKFAVIAVLCLAFLKLNLLAFQFVELGPCIEFGKYLS